jgi:hypothetical protein
MTNLLFLLNEYALSGTVTANTTATGYPAANLVTGWRGEKWKASAAAASHNIDFDLGADNGPVNACFVADAKWFQSEATAGSITLQHSTDDVTYTDIADHDCDTDALSGPHNKDLILYDGAYTDTARRYGRVILESTNDVQAELTKVYLGAAFDPGRDPSAMTITRSRAQYASHAVYSLSLDYIDISYAKALQMIDWIGRVSDYHPIVLFTVTDHAALLDLKCLHCRVLDWRAPQEITNRNNFTLFLEQII